MTAKNNVGFKAGGTLHMAEPFLSEIRLFSFNFAPKGWALCNGQTNFALPDLRGRCAMHEGNGFTLGQAGGEIAHTLSLNELPTHVHFLQGANKDGANPIPTGNLLGNFNNGYGGATHLTPLLAGTVSNIGGSQAHPNMSPYLAINFCIALQGIFPSQN